MNDIERYHNLVDRIRSGCGKIFIADPDLFRELINIIDRNPEMRPVFLKSIFGLIEELIDTHDPKVYVPIFYILNTCMEHLKWQEVEEHLKHRFPAIIDPHVKLLVELSIKLIYDRKWDHGRIRHIPEDFYNTRNVLRNKK